MDDGVSVLFGKVVWGSKSSFRSGLRVGGDRGWVGRWEFCLQLMGGVDRMAGPVECGARGLRVGAGHARVGGGTIYTFDEDHHAQAADAGDFA